MEEADKALPVDKGYAWVIVSVTFCLYALAAGGFKCQGVLFVELLDRYEGVYKPSSLLAIFTVAYTLGCFFGCLAAYMILKIGYRATQMIGITALSFSFIGMAFAPNLPAFFILYSVPAGLGTETIIITSLLVSGPYFRKRKALAIGLIASGSGVGSIILPSIIRFLFNNVHFSGALLIYGGFHLQFLVLASLLRPISYYQREVDCFRKKGLFKTNIAETEPLTLDDKEKEKEDVTRISEEVSSASSADPKTECLTNGSSQNRRNAPNTDLDCHVTELDGEKLEDNNKNSRRKTKEKFAWKILLYPKFLMLLFSILAYTMGLAVFYTCLPALGEESGISREIIALALGIAGGLEIPCRIANGIFADRNIISATSQYTICLFVAGGLALSCTAIPGLTGIVLALSGMSTMGNSVFNLLPLVMRELVGKENVTSGMGLQSVVQVCSFLSATYITGSIYGVTATWKTTFFYIGGIMMLGSIILWPFLIKQKMKRPQLLSLAKE
ncbi:monocarboxylate transporter 12-like [Watersipora subatra]|uniref:monocarboxylate transporter 12-like n=1 Tax=Watersipora subatra TaxID=2589382 RepID=UPI00355BF3CD